MTSASLLRADILNGERHVAKVPIPEESFLDGDSNFC